MKLPWIRYLSGFASIEVSGGPRGFKVGSVVSEFVVSRHTYKKDVVGIFTYKKNHTHQSYVGKYNQPYKDPLGY